MAHDKFYGICENKCLVEIKHDNIPGTVAIAHGGTGATTSSGALTNLGLTATATELNYTDGVTSNIQTQLNGKAPYVVKENTDFNDMKTPGLYTMRSSSTNAPTSGAYHSLFVNKSDTAGYYLQQLAIKESTWDLYSRYLSGSTWSAWKQYALAESVPAKESGSWTPTFGYWGSGGPSYTISYCYYNRVGDFVHLTATLKITSSPSSGNNLSMGGLPFTPTAYATGTYTFNPNIELKGGDHGSGVLRLHKGGGSITFASTRSEAISNGDYLAISITYKVS